MLLLSQFIFQCKVIDDDDDVDRDGDNDDEDSGLAATNVGIIYVQYIHLYS